MAFREGDRVTVVTRVLRRMPDVVSRVLEDGGIWLRDGGTFDADGVCRLGGIVHEMAVPRGDRAAIRRARQVMTDAALQRMKRVDLSACRTVDDVEAEARTILTRCAAFRVNFLNETPDERDREIERQVY